MKYLYILRHAKSSWDDRSVADFDRPLNQRGLKAAPLIGSVTAQRGLRPDVIISSPAKRAMQTAALVKDASGSTSPIRYDSRIYEAAVGTLALIISEIDDNNASAMIVGHNPGMEGLIEFLTGTRESMPTAALASVSLTIDAWADAGPRSGTLQFIIRPKDEMRASADSDK